MSNSIILFDNQVADGDSVVFTINRPASKGYADTQFSSYLEIYSGAGGLGSGTLSLFKEAKDGVFRKLAIESNTLNNNFPAIVGEMLIESMNYKSDEKFKLVLAGATGANLFVNGYNIKLST